MSESIYYEIWIKDRKDETKKEIIIPIEAGTARSIMRVKDYVCENGFFKWRDYAKLKIKRLKIVY